MSEIEYRYELKFVITDTVAEMLKNQLKMVMSLDSHSVCDEYSYIIRSLYFDDVNATAYREKVDGEEFRRKYRIRMYNNDPSHIVLECKHKDEDMTYKESVVISEKMARGLINERYLNVIARNELLQKFIGEALSKPLKPAVIVEYKRLAFVYPTSEVRITFDSELRSGRYSSDFFNPDVTTFDMFQQGLQVLEVKCNEYIPSHITAILNSVPLLRQAVSKFALCSAIK